MDAISGFASLVALIEAAAVIGGAAVQLCLNVHGAPSEIALLKSRLLTIKLELENIKVFQSDQQISRHITSPEAQKLFADGFQSAEETIRKIHDACQYSCRRGSGNRFYWALLDRKTVRGLLDDLQRTESSLSTVLHFLSIRQSFDLSSSVAQIATVQMKMVEEIVSLKEELKASKQLPSPAPWPKRGNSDCVMALPTTPRIARSRSIPDPLFSGLTGRLSSLRNNEAIAYSLSLRTKFPFINRAFIVDLAIRQSSLSWSNVSILSGTLGWKNVVPEDADIMTACQRGDFREVRNLFLAKLASPNDMTLSNSTPLRYAIESGSVELVELLLKEGADPNCTFGRFQTPLDWALQQKTLGIARLLLSWKASLDHVSAHGWTPLFYIWGNPSNSAQLPSVDFIKLLAAVCNYNPSELDDCDVQGWAPLHRAAAFGTPEDIAQFIKLGASTSSRIPPLQWYPIHEAVFYGNLECFLELLPHCQGIDIDSQDTRGWTLLHIAASAGRQSIIRRLLEIGADPYRQSWPWHSHMPESLYGKRCTPAEVARAQSEERFAQYIDTLRSLGLLGDEDDTKEYDSILPDVNRTMDVN